MAVRRNFGNGRTAANENDMTIVSTSYNGGGPLVIVCHGAGTGPSNYVSLAVRRNLQVLADMGFVVVVSDLGGANTWAIDTAVHATTGRIATLRTWAASTWGADITKTVLIGDSMGGMNALIYMTLAPAGTVKACALRAPTVLADALHDRDAFFGGLIDTAWGSGANWDAAKATRDPASVGPVAAIAPMRDQIRIWYSTADTVVLPADIATYAGTLGIQTTSVGAVNHQDITSAVDPLELARWIWSKVN